MFQIFVIVLLFATIVFPALCISKEWTADVFIQVYIESLKREA